MANFKVWPSEFPEMGMPSIPEWIQGYVHNTTFTYVNIAYRMKVIMINNTPSRK